MKSNTIHTLTSVLLVALLVLTTSLAAQARDDIDATLAKLTGEAPYDGWTAEAVQKAQLAAFKHLILPMGAESPLERAEPQMTFEKISRHASRPGADAERKHWCRILCGAQNPVIPRPSRIWMLRKLGEIGGAESVPALASLLGSDDADIRELARRALQRNPAADAATVLIDAFKAVTHPDDQIAFLNALGGRRAATALEPVSQACLSENDNVARAAIAALADIGGNRALSTLMELHNAGGTERYAAAAAALRVAQRDATPERAAFVQRDVLRDDSPATIRMACLSGLSTTDPAFCFAQLDPIVRGTTSPELRHFAIGLIRNMKDPEVLNSVCASFPQIDADGQILLLAMFSDLGESTRAGGPALLQKTAVRKTVLAALNHNDSNVRGAALDALTQLGQAGDVSAIAKVASSDASVRKAARRTLERLRGADADVAIRKGIRGGGESSVRSEYIRAATARGDRDAIPMLQELARGDDPKLQVAALDGLAALCGPDQVGSLLPLLGAGSTARARDAAEQAIAILCRKDDDETRRVQPLVALVKNSQQIVTQAAAVRILGRVQGDAALPAIRMGLTRDETVREASIRALASWQTPTVLPELLLAAGSDAPRAQKIVALRGYFRLLREPSPRTDVETLALVEQALPLASRADEQRLALSVIGSLGVKEALVAAEGHLDNDELAAEAARAVADIASRVSAYDATSANAALERLSQRPLDDRLRTHVAQTRKRIEDHRGFVGSWRYAGPYVHASATGADLLHATFPPDSKRAASVEWKRLRTSNPWILDFTELDSGSQRVIYVSAHLQSDRDQDVVFAMGSDDGLLVRINGEVVHDNAVMRALVRGQDKVRVKLRKGPNIIEAKISQGGGGWGFCLRIEDETGAPAEGLDVRTW